jgi:hypothetical protein
VIPNFLLYSVLCWTSKLRVLLGVLFVSGGTANAEQQISAEWVETRLEQSGSSRTYAGKVAFRDSLNALQILADSAIVTGSKYVFVSNLSFQDSNRTIQAKQLVYDQGVAQFSGSVFLQDGQRSLRAPNVKIWPDSGQVLAWGGAAFSFQSHTRHIVAEKLKYGSDGGFGVAVGQVVATVLGKQGDSLRIETDSLRFSPEQEKLEFWGASKVSQSGMVLVAPFGNYGKNRLQAFGRPEVIWIQQDRPDSIWAKADSVDMSLEDQVLRSFHLLSAVEMQLSGQREAYVQTVQGDSAVIDVADNKISRLQVFGQVRLGFQQRGSKIDIEGDSTAVWFRDGRLDSLVVFGRSGGTYQGADNSVGKMSGDQKILWFENDDLVKMRLVGSAECTYEPSDFEEGSRVNIGGDLLDLFFANGELAHIDAQGKVQGVHLQSKAKNKP